MALCFQTVAETVMLSVAITTILKQIKKRLPAAANIDISATYTLARPWRDGSVHLKNTG